MEERMAAMTASTQRRFVWGDRGPKNQEPSPQYCTQIFCYHADQEVFHIWSCSAMQRQTLKRPVERDRWRPQDGDQYFVILGDGNIRHIFWHSTPFDYDAWGFGNCFRLRSDAEQARDALKGVLLHLHMEYV
jgi:hypothetical protein